MQNMPPIIIFYQTRCDQRSLVFYNAFCAFSKKLFSFLENLSWHCKATNLSKCHQFAIKPRSHQRSPLFYNDFPGSAIIFCTGHQLS
jgi:hypothetical protein